MRLAPRVVSSLQGQRPAMQQPAATPLENGSRPHVILSSAPTGRDAFAAGTTSTRRYGVGGLDFAPLGLGPAMRRAFPRGDAPGCCIAGPLALEEMQSSSPAPRWAVRVTQAGRFPRGDAPGCCIVGPLALHYRGPSGTPCQSNVRPLLSTGPTADDATAPRVVSSLQGQRPAMQQPAATPLENESPTRHLFLKPQRGAMPSRIGQRPRGVMASAVWISPRWGLGLKRADRVSRGDAPGCCIAGPLALEEMQATSAPASLL